MDLERYEQQVIRLIDKKLNYINTCYEHVEENHLMSKKDKEIRKVALITSKEILKSLLCDMRKLKQENGFTERILYDEQYNEIQL